MNPTTEQVLDAALALPDGDRLELVEALIVSLHPDDEPPLDDSWRKVIARRAAEIESGAVPLIPWSEVKEHARNAPGD